MIHGAGGLHNGFLSHPGALGMADHSIGLTCIGLSVPASPRGWAAEASLPCVFHTVLVGSDRTRMTRLIVASIALVLGPVSLESL